MKRKLLTQMRNEWRINIWLGLELLIISVLLWFISLSVCLRVSIINEPLGFEYDHCYEISFGYLNEKSPLFLPDRTSSEAMAEDISTLLTRLETRPEVEAAALAVNALPYNMSNNGTRLSVDSLSTGDTFVVQRMVSPGFAKVFRLRGLDGETPEDIARILEENPSGLMIAGNIFGMQSGHALSQYIGRTFVSEGNGNREVTLTTLLQPIRYSDYQASRDAVSVVQPLPNDMLPWVNEIAVRVAPGLDKDFPSTLLADADKSLQVGNFYVSGVRSYDDRREKFNLDEDHNMGRLLVGAGFLMVNVFLGLLGTFWFRTRQREPEIAIRRVNGATTASIFRRIISEGLLLLTAVTPVALAIDYLIVRYNIGDPTFMSYTDPGMHILSAIVAYALMAMVIVAGILPPAMRACRLEPAEVLSQE